MRPLVEVTAPAAGRPVPDGADVTFCGPWVGELGVEMLRWVPYLRAIKAAHPERRLLAAGYANSTCLYRDFADEFWVLDEGYRQAFLNRETSFNYGTFHEVSGNTAYREHAERKGFASTAAEHRAIAAAWFGELQRRRLRPSLVVSALGESRLHRPLTASDEARAHAFEQLGRTAASAPAARILMLLPRLRALQGEQRSWSPGFYRRIIWDLAALPDTRVTMVGSATHEEALAALDAPHVINLIGAGLDLQLAFWELASLGSGPPSGGLVPGYFTDTALLHWYKPGHFPTRHGRPWNEVAEPDYEVFGIKSAWIEVDETAFSAQRLVDAIAARVATAGSVAGARTS